MNETLKPVDKMTDEELVREWLERSGWRRSSYCDFFRYTKDDVCFFDENAISPLTNPAESEKVLEWLAKNYRVWISNICYRRGLMDWNVSVYDRGDESFLCEADYPNLRRAILEAAMAMKRIEGKE